MRRRKFTIVATVVVVIAGLGACSAASPATSTISATPSGTIGFSWWGGATRNTLTQGVIDLYKKANPGVTVNGTNADFATYWQKASVQAAGKNLPCVPQMQNRTMADYSDRGSLMPLDGLVKSGAIDVSNIPQGVLDSGRGSDGKLYEIPYGVAFASMYVNATQVQALGLQMPPDGYTWDWLSKWLKSISAKTGHPATPLMGGNNDVFESWVRSHGEDLFNAKGGLGFTKATVKALWQYSEDLRTSSTSDSAQRASETVNQANEQSDFALGVQQVRELPQNALASLQATLSKAHPDQKITQLLMPTGTSGNGEALWASGLSISANCNNVSTAASFINFFVNDEQAALAFQSDNGATTQTKNVAALLASPTTTDATKAQLKIYQSVVATKVKPSVYKAGYSAIFSNGGGMVNRYYQQVAFGQLSIDDAVNQLFVEANAQLGQ